jgi:hypothetical protein
LRLTGTGVEVDTGRARAVEQQFTVGHEHARHVHAQRAGRERDHAVDEWGADRGGEVNVGFDQRE